jgi:hypothetical protein
MLNPSPGPSPGSLITSLDPSSFAALTHSVIGKMPYPWQQMVLETISQMVVNDYCVPLSLVSLTGRGRYTVWDTFAILFLAGITLTPIMPLLLSLGTLQSIDQQDHGKKLPLGWWAVTAFPLDELKDPGV